MSLADDPAATRKAHGAHGLGAALEALGASARRLAQGLGPCATRPVAVAPLALPPGPRVAALPGGTPAPPASAPGAAPAPLSLLLRLRRQAEQAATALVNADRFRLIDAHYQPPLQGGPAPATALAELAEPPTPDQKAGEMARELAHLARQRALAEPAPPPGPAGRMALRLLEAWRTTTRPRA